VANGYEIGVRAFEKGDFKTALKIWRPLAEKGDVQAQGGLGLLYLYGNGVKQDYAEAAKWLLKAAEQGNSGAQLSLAMQYASGLGVEQNFIEGYKWFTILESNEAGMGDMERPMITEARELLNNQMTSEQIEEAKEIAKIWMRQKRREFVAGSLEGLFNTFEKIPGLPQNAAQFFTLYQQMEPLLKEIRPTGEEIKGNAQQRLLAASKLFALYAHTSACLAGSVLVLGLFGHIIEFIWDELTKEQRESLGVFVETLNLDPEIQDSSKRLEVFIRNAQERKQEVLQLIRQSGQAR
jgi:hypothetical protein